jgi:signal transduction histidine kinase
MRHIGNLTFLIFFIVQLSGQTLVETKIQLLEKIIHDTTRQEIVRAKAISEIDEIYWASQPRMAGKYFQLIQSFQKTSPSDSLDIEISLMKIRKSFNQSRFSECLQQCARSLELTQEIDDIDESVRILSFLIMLNNADRSGNLLGLEKKANEYITKAKLLSDKVKNYKVLSAFYQAQVGYLLMQNKVEEAKEVLVNNEVNLKFRLSGVDQIIHLSYTYNLLGRCFLMTNELANSEFYLSKAQDMTEKYDLGGIKYVVYIHLGLLKEKQKQFSEASFYFDKCYGEINIMSKNKIPSILQILSGFYERQNQWEKAFQLLKMYNSVKDSIFNADKMNNFIEQQEKLGLKDKELQIEKLNFKSGIEKEKNRNFKIIASIVLIFLLGLIFLGSIYYINKRNLIEETDQKQLLMSILTHDIRSPILGVQMGMPIVLKSIKENGKSEMSCQLEFLYGALTELNTITENLFNFINLKSKRNQIHFSTFNVKNEMDLVVDELFYKTERKGIKIVKLSPGDFTVKTDRTIFLSIFRNVLDNAIKYTYENTSIEIDTFHRDDCIIVSVRDFGPGVGSEIGDKIFDIKGKTHFTEIDGEKGSRIGLFVAKKLAALCKMELAYIKVSPGAKFEIIIPYK